MGLKKALREHLDIRSIPKVIAKEDYGYQEFIPSKPPTTITAQEIGTLMGTLDVLGMVDIHIRNLILDSERALIIDGESILHHSSNKRLHNQSTIPPLGDSILSMGIISPPFRQPILGSSFSLFKHGLALFSEPDHATLNIGQIDNFVYAKLSEHEQSIIDSYGKQLDNPNGAGGIERRNFKALKGLKRRVVMRNQATTGIYSPNQSTRNSSIEKAINSLWQLLRIWANKNLSS